jgi:hypothetical protein
VIVKPGDRVRITRRYKNGTSETWEARVHFAEDRGDFVYFGYVPVKSGTALWDNNRGQFGYERAYKPNAPTPQYAATVEIIGTCGPVK